MTIGTNGGIYTNTLQPAFLSYQASNATNATGNSTNYTLGTTVDLTGIFDQNSNMNNTTGTFTAPLTGIYMFSASAAVTNTTVANAFSLFFISSNRSYLFSMARSALSGNQTPAYKVLADMDAADTCIVIITAGGEAAATDTVAGDANAFTSFGGIMVA